MWWKNASTMSPIEVDAKKGPFKDENKSRLV